jgi:hypothetical protein
LAVAWILSGRAQPELNAQVGPAILSSVAPAATSLFCSTVMASADRVASLDTLAPDDTWRVREGDRGPESRVERQFERIAAFLRTDGLLVVIVAYVALVFTMQLRLQVAADTWLNLVGGREIVRHGIPHHDVLAVMSRGYEWIDQQWLANLFYYGFYAIGGLPAVAQVNVLLFSLGIALALLIARRRGASPVAVAVCALPAVFIAPAFARAQVLVEPLFVIFLAVLAAESRRPTKRVLVAFPLLILWANLHGSVVIGAALVALLGASELVRVLRSRTRERRAVARAALLLVAPWSFVFASPYSLHLVSYYQATVGNSEFPKFLSEWRPAGPLTPWGIALILLAGWAAFLVGRRPRGLTAFELLALLLTLVAAATAARSIVWFTYAGALLLPQLVQFTSGGSRHPRDRNLVAAAGLAALLAAVLVIGHSLLSPPAAVAREDRQQAVDRIARVLRADPNARVFATYDVADWVLFRVPEARGRIAYDGRWEILPENQIAALVDYLSKGGRAWERPSYGYRLVVLNPEGQKAVFNTYMNRPGLRVLYRDRNVAVFDRGTGASASHNP